MVLFLVLLCIAGPACSSDRRRGRQGARGATAQQHQHAVPLQLPTRQRQQLPQQQRQQQQCGIRGCGFCPSRRPANRDPSHCTAQHRWRLVQRCRVRVCNDCAGPCVCEGPAGCDRREWQQEPAAGAACGAAGTGAGPWCCCCHQFAVTGRLDTPWLGIQAVSGTGG